MVYVVKNRKTYENLRQLVLIDEFKSCVYNDVKTYVDEQKAADFGTTARLVDGSSLTYKFSFDNVKNSIR